MHLQKLKVTQRNKLSSLLMSSPFAIAILFSLLCQSLSSTSPFQKFLKYDVDNILQQVMTIQESDLFINS